MVIPTLRNIFFKVGLFSLIFSPVFINSCNFIFIFSVLMHTLAKLNVSTTVRTAFNLARSISTTKMVQIKVKGLLGIIIYCIIVYLRHFMTFQSCFSKIITRISRKAIKSHQSISSRTHLRIKSISLTCVPTRKSLYLPFQVR